MRSWKFAVLALVLVIVTWNPALVEAIVRERAIAHGVSADRLVDLAGCESKFNPDAIGALGELGLMQLHPDGLYQHFRLVGYLNPFSPWESADYTARVFQGEWLAEGVGRWAWSCAA